jgi:methylthioribose-1-phosphate isomerase
MQVRGAPLIGAVAAFGLAFVLHEGCLPAKAHAPEAWMPQPDRPELEALPDEADRLLMQGRHWLTTARPTAVNLAWALDRVVAAVRALAPADRAQAAWAAALALCDEDVHCNQRIGEHGAILLAQAGAQRLAAGLALQVLTHCNAGRLATVGHGTALAPIYHLHARGVPVHVWVDETRPRNQGAALTAWELGEAGIAHTVIADNAGGLLMMRGRVDAVIVGCDRVAANGDVANKVGTYLKALAAADNRVPFYVACPVSTIDPLCADGGAIEVEERSPRELTHLSGRLPDGSVAEVQLVPDGTQAANPAFDITPAHLVRALITERGPCEASFRGISAVCPELFFGVNRPASNVDADGKRGA